MKNKLFTILITFVVPLNLWTQLLLECNCVSSLKRKYTSLPTVGDFIKKDFAKEFIQWKSLGDNIQHTLFYADFQGTNSQLYFNLVSFRPVRLEHPGNTYVINLTPCQNPDKFYSFHTEVQYEHFIKRYIPNFDYERFNHSTASYFAVFKAIGIITVEEMLLNVIYDNSPSDSEAIIKRINSIYKTTVDPAANDYILLIEALLKEFEEKKIDPYDAILNAYVLNGLKDRLPGIEEQERLMVAFPSLFFERNFEKAEDYIRPKTTIKADVSKARIEISDKVLRVWDDKLNKSATDSIGKLIPGQVTFNMSSLRYNSVDGLAISPSSICAPIMQISNTNIVLTLTDAKLIDAPLKSSANFFYDQYPFFLKDKDANLPVETGHDIFQQQSGLYNESLTGFSGLYAQANVQFMLKNIVFYLATYNLLINNDFITGTINFPGEGLKNLKQLPENFTIIMGDKKISTTVSKLKAECKKLGFKETIFRVKDGFVLMDFRILAK